MSSCIRGLSRPNQPELRTAQCSELLRRPIAVNTKHPQVVVDLQEFCAPYGFETAADGLLNQRQARTARARRSTAAA